MGRVFEHLSRGHMEYHTDDDMWPPIEMSDEALNEYEYAYGKEMKHVERRAAKER